MSTLRHSWHARTDDLGGGRKLFVTQRGMNADRYLYGGTVEQTDPDTGEKFTHKTKAADGAFTGHPCDIRMDRFRQPLVLKHGGSVVTMRPLEVKGATAGLKSLERVSYAQVWPGVDCIRRITPEGIKSDYLITAPPPSEIGFEVVGDTKAFLAWHREPYIVRPGVEGVIPVPWRFDGRILAYDLRGAQVGDVVDPTLTLQPDAAAGKDTWLYSTYTARNYGITTANHVGLGRALMLAFDLSELLGTDVTSAQIDLHCDSVTGDHTSTMTKVLVGWTEGTKNNATAAAGESTWGYRAYDTVTWSTAGCLGSGTDIAAAPSVSVAVTTAMTGFVAFSGVGLVSDVQDIADGGANDGWRAYGTAGAAMVTVKSSDNATAANRPRFTSEYTEAASGSLLSVQGFRGMV
jgi:hypothetical protein